MSSFQLNGSFNLLGQAEAPAPAPPLDGPGEPQLHVGWSDFHQGIGSSFLAVFSGPAAPAGFFSSGFFKDCCIERRIPRRAVVAAALLHIAFLILPFPELPFTPRHNPAFDNFQLTWSGPIEDLPLIQSPAPKARPSPRGEPGKVLPREGADAFHPRQTIVTDPLRPTHPRQTLINPAAPAVAPKLLTQLPNIVQFQQDLQPARPKIEISQEALRQLHPRQRSVATVTVAPPLAAPSLEPRPSDIGLAVPTAVPAKPRLELNAGAAPLVAKKARPGDVGPAPDVGTSMPTAANGSAAALIALSSAPAPVAPLIQPPAGNLAARVTISPEGKRHGVPGGSPAGPSDATGNAGGNAASLGGTGSGSSAGNPIGLSISGGNPRPDAGTSGLGGNSGKINAPVPHIVAPRIAARDIPAEPVRTGPPNFSALAPGAKPESVFGSKRVYTLNVNMPNLSSASGSWILHFSELRPDPGAPRYLSPEVSGPVPVKKVDPVYPPALIAEHVQGEVILYAVIRKDGSVDSIQLVSGIDERLDDNAMVALSQWKFRPATKHGEPVDLEAVVHIPFRLPEPTPF